MTTEKYAYGITSKCNDGNHVFMSDIDENIPLENIINILQDMSRCYLLNKLFVLKSTNGYNIIGLDKISLKLIYLINKRYPSIDQQYNELQYNNRGFYTIRMDNDKKLIYEHSGKPIYVCSNAHRRFLNDHFNINIPNGKNYDDSMVLTIIRFKNKKHGI